MEPAFRRTSGGWMTGPAFVSATSSASTHGRTAGKSSAIRATVGSLREAGKTPRGRFAARTGADTVAAPVLRARYRSEEHTSELQSHHDLVCRLLLEKKKQ